MALDCLALRHFLQFSTDGCVVRDLDRILSRCVVLGDESWNLFQNCFASSLGLEQLTVDQRTAVAGEQSEHQSVNSHLSLLVANKNYAVVNRRSGGTDGGDPFGDRADDTKRSEDVAYLSRDFSVALHLVFEKCYVNDEGVDA